MREDEEPEPPPPPLHAERRARWVCAALLLVAASYYAWNAYTLRPWIGYDAQGHREYIDLLVNEHRLPEPLEGWATFHPPLYYLLGSVLRPALEPLGVQWTMLGLRGLSAIAILVVGLVSFRMLWRRQRSVAVAAVITALVLFVPVAQLAATMVGNEALAAGLAALCVPVLCRLQRDPSRVRDAALAGLLAGLALATKYTGAFVAVACLVPFCRRGLGRRHLRAMLAGGLLGVALAGPVYARNLWLTGSAFPMTRLLEPMRSTEAQFILRERRLTDYLWVNPASLWRPSIYHVADAPPSSANRNPAMSSVWGLLYATLWYDGQAHRIAGGFHRDGVYSGRVLTGLGLVPTALLVAGFLAALGELRRRRSRFEDAPVVVMALLGLGAFIAFTWGAPSMAAVKGSYLLPLLAPAALFYLRGLRLLSGGIRAAALGVSLAAAVAAAVVFANGLVFPRIDPIP